MPEEFDFDDAVIPSMQCDVELEFTGPNFATMGKWAADVFRRLAVSIERDEFPESGFYDLRDSVGKKVGTVYFNYEGEAI